MAFLVMISEVTSPDGVYAENGKQEKASCDTLEKVKQFVYLIGEIYV